MDGAKERAVFKRLKLISEADRRRFQQNIAEMLSIEILDYHRKNGRVTMILGQPTIQDINRLEEELMWIAAKETTTLGGGEHGHIGMIMESTKYLAMTNSIPFIHPTTNPGLVHIPPMTEETQYRVLAERE